MSEPSDLLTEDGRVDARLLNGGRAYKIDAATCATVRRRCREEYARLSHLAEEYGVSDTTIATHVHGECDHDHDTPAVERGDA